jgi:NhaP-type Na+/H+ or K+/H+ antiporter
MGNLVVRALIGASVGLVVGVAVHKLVQLTTSTAAR